jgi:hypothetical protein
MDSYNVEIGKKQIEYMGVSLQNFLQKRLGCNTMFYYYDWITARERVDMSLPFLLEYHNFSIEDLMNTNLSTYIITVGVEIDNYEYVVNKKNELINAIQFERLLNDQVERETISVSNKEQDGKLFKLYKFLVQI